MKVLVVDDEPLARQRLVALLGELAMAEVVGEAANGLAALEEARRLVPDIVLLDVRMPGMDGMEAARHLACLAAPPAVIFTTAYDEHALAAFEARAVDYLVKPVRRERLAAALERATVLRAGHVALAPFATHGARRHVSAVSGGALRLLPLAEVAYFQADHGYVSAVAPGLRLLIEDTLRALEEEFADELVRVHRNALVNRAAVRALEKDAEGNTLVAFRNLPERLVVSRRLLGGVRRRLRER